MKCVVCSERLGGCGMDGTWCVECAANYTRSSDVPTAWAAKRARSYERRRWVKLIELARDNGDLTDGAVETMLALRRAKR